MISFLIGVLAAVLSGMGVGGGGLLILWLTFCTDWELSASRGINLLFFCISVLSALPFHFSRRAPRFSAVFLLLCAALPGVVCGCALSRVLPSSVLRRIFGIFLMLAGGSSALRLLFPKHGKERRRKRHREH